MKTNFYTNNQTFYSLKTSPEVLFPYNGKKHKGIKLQTRLQSFQMKLHVQQRIRRIMRMILEGKEITQIKTLVNIFKYNNFNKKK